METREYRSMSHGSPFRRLVAECLVDRGRLLAAAFALALCGAGQLALTWLVKLWVDGLSAGGTRPPVASLLSAAAVLTLTMSAALLLSRVLLASLSQRLLGRLRRAAADRLLAVRVAEARALASGDVLARVAGDASSLGAFVETLLKRVLGDGLVALGALVLMFTISFPLALGACLLVPLVGALLARLGRTIRRLGAASQREAGDLTALLAEQLRGLTTIKGFQAEAFERLRFAEGDARTRARALAAERWAALLVAAVFLATGLALLGGIAWGSRTVSSGALSAAGLLTFCLYAAQTIEPMRRLADVHGMLQRTLASAARVFEVIDLPGGERAGALSLPAAVSGALRIEHLRFRHRDDVPLLEGVDLTVRAGETVAIVAASGGGKSTLAALLARHLDPRAGRILLDGVDLAEARLVEVRRAVCVVEQEPFLFSGPLLENLRYGSWDAPEERVREAVRLTGLDALAASLPRGLATPLAEAGRDLSGGEKQRIALARAVVRDPALLVLDEATSALDGDAEERIFAAMAPWLALRTVVVMAHRLATVARVPRIVVLDRGRVAGDGDAATLLGACAPFAALYQGQVEPVALPVMGHPFGVPPAPPAS